MDNEAKRMIYYLMHLADWCCGRGICQIEGLEDPDEWCFRFWQKHGPANGDGYSAKAMAEAFVRTYLEQKQ